jgi:hypothetical protein
MYGLTSDLVNAALADRRRDAGRIALENAATIRPETNRHSVLRVVGAVRGILTGARRNQRRPARRPVTAG